MKPLFNEFDYGSIGHKKLFDEDQAMDFMGRNHEFLPPSYYPPTFYEEPNYFPNNEDFLRKDTN